MQRLFEAALLVEGGVHAVQSAAEEDPAAAVEKLFAHGVQAGESATSE